MTSFSYSALSEKLAAGSVEFVGNNQVKLNLNQVTGDNLTLESSVVEGTVKFLTGLANLTEQINASLVEQNMPPIQFVTQSLTGTPAQPEYEFTVRVSVNTAQFIENLKDPTE